MYAKQNTKYAKQSAKYVKQNTKFANRNTKYVKQNTKYAKQFQAEEDCDVEEVGMIKKLLKAHILKRKEHF